MLDRGEGVFTRIVAHVRALLPEDWFGSAGRKFRETTNVISAATTEFIEEHELHPSQILDEAVDLGRTKLTGLAHKEFAAALKDYSETEQAKINVRLQLRTLESKVRKEEAEARLAEIRVVDAEIELLKKLEAVGCGLNRDAAGTLTIFPSRVQAAELLNKMRLH